MQPISSPSTPDPEEQLRHDKYLDEMGASQMDKKHGGELFEAISMDDLVLVNDPACPHAEWELDPTETLGTAYVCKNPKCGIVRIYNNLDEE